MAKIILNFGGVRYGSSLDEDMFFNWLNKISSIENIKGSGHDLFVSLKRKNISEHDLRELLSLCHRYDVDMKQLSALLTDKNKSWFCDQECYWYKKVFVKTEKGQNNV